MKKIVIFLLTLALCVPMCPFSMAESTTLAFSDVQNQSMAIQESIEKLRENGILTGYPDGTYRPDSTITRAEFAAVLSRLYEDSKKNLADGSDSAADTSDTKSFAGSKNNISSRNYSDVSGFYTEYIDSVTSLGFMKGTGNGKFNPTAHITQQEAATALLRWAGMKDSQFSAWPKDYISMAENVGMTEDITFDGSADITRAQTASMADNTSALYEALNGRVPEIFIYNGQAQPVFTYEDMVREVVYVETENDTDNDGKNDLLQVLVQRPAASERGLKVAAIYEARPYSAGVTDAYDYDSYNAHIVNADLNGKKDTAPQSAEIKNGDTNESMNTASDIWETTENVDAYDYWLVRGYAYVSCSGLGTAGSEGIQTCGSADEVSANVSVIDWMNGRAKAYTDRTRNSEVTADWCTGNVAMSGQSYGGTTAFGVAVTGVEGLKTIVPRAGISSWYDYYRSQGTAAGGLYYPGDDCDILAYYCMSRLNNISEDSDLAVSYGNYLKKMIADEDRISGDYNSFWDERNYAKHSENLKCSALIIHGLNDFNVRTKQFDMMYDAFEEAGCTAKLILHQGAHYTPEQIANLNYNDILGRWYAHYLYDVDNGAEGDPAVRVQSNVDLTWQTYRTWGDASDTLIYDAGSMSDIKDAESTFTSDLTETGFDTSLADKDEAWIEYVSDMSYDWESAIISGSTDASAVYSFGVSEDTHISGTPVVTVRAAANQSTGILSAMLVDISNEGMNAVTLEKYTESVPTVDKEGSIWYGAGLENKGLLQFATTSVDKKIMTRGWMDICNRNSITESEPAVPGQYYTYEIELQPVDYTVTAGHRLALVLYSTDVEVTYWPEKITEFTVDNSSISVSIPIKK